MLTDLERFYFQYQTEELPHGESLQSFCVKHKVPYNIFQKWFKDTHKKVVEVLVDDVPMITHYEIIKLCDQPKPVSKSSNDNSVRIWIDILYLGFGTRFRKRPFYSMNGSCGREVLMTFWVLRD